MKITSENFTRINNDINGNGRYVLHFTALMLPTDAEYPADRYAIALARSRALGGRKYHTKSYGGGIVFQSCSLTNLVQQVNALIAN